MINCNYRMELDRNSRRIFFFLEDWHSGCGKVGVIIYTVTVYRCVDVIVPCRLVRRERWSIDRNLTWRRIKEARQKGWREEGKNLKTLCLSDAILSFLAPATAERTPRSTYFKWQKASLFRAPRFIPFPLSPFFSLLLLLDMHRCF